MRRSLLTVACIVALTACGGDDERIPPIIDAPLADAPVVDAPSPDAAQPDAALPDGGGIVDTAGAPDAASIDASAFDVNGCTLATATDATAAGASRAIAFPGFAYTPRCLRIAVGQSVTWTGTFLSHPLRAGVVVGGVPQPQPGGPIVNTDSGTSVTFAFPAAGVFPYYCNIHGGGGMNGVVYVE